MLPSINW